MNFQSGKTQAIDLDELNVETANRPKDYKARNEFELDKWNDDPWASTEEGRRKRRWAEDDRWAGDDEDSKQQDTAERWDVDEEALKSGWKAPKRGDQLETNEGWDDWGNFGGGPKPLDEENGSKDFGGHRRVQAASQYATEDSSNYVDGRQNRDDLYRSKEGFGTAGLKERRGDPYAQQQPAPSESLPAMKEVGTGWDDVQSKAAKDAEEELKAAKLSTTQGGDDIPGVTRASIIVFLAGADPVACELKKMVTTIGRAEDNLVVVCDQYTSRHHISINFSSGRFELVAVSQDNLTTVNGYPATHVILKHEDQIEIGAARIKFVVGPVSDIHMQLCPPRNGEPMHLEPAPDRVRSVKTTRKNLIILIAVVATFIVILMAALAIIVSGRGASKDSAQIAANDDNEKNAEVAAEELEAPDTHKEKKLEEVKPVVLDEKDAVIVDSLFEAISQGAGQTRNSPAEITGDIVKFKITSIPEGARIYNQDGTLRGTTPYEIEELVSQGREETWTIRLDDYKDVEQTISLKEGAILNIELEKIDVAPTPKPEPKKTTTKKSSPKKSGAKKTGSKTSGRSGGGKRPILL